MSKEPQGSLLQYGKGEWKERPEVNRLWFEYYFPLDVESGLVYPDLVAPEPVVDPHLPRVAKRTGIQAAESEETRLFVSHAIPIAGIECRKRRGINEESVRWEPQLAARSGVAGEIGVALVDDDNHSSPSLAEGRSLYFSIRGKEGVSGHGEARGQLIQRGKHFIGVLHESVHGVHPGRPAIVGTRE